MSRGAKPRSKEIIQDIGTHKKSSHKIEEIDNENKVPARIQSSYLKDNIWIVIGFNRQS